LTTQSIELGLDLWYDGSIGERIDTASLVNKEMEHDYWAEPHTTVNRDFTRVLLTSNWGSSGTGAVEVWMAALPPGWDRNSL
jgi:hypothetical protein